VELLPATTAPQWLPEKGDGWLETPDSLAEGVTNP